MGILISIVVAAAENNVIGNDGGMPWQLSTDLKRFKALTIGKPVVMGRKTFESIGKPLPGRTTIVITRDNQWQAEGVVPAPSLDVALELAKEVAASTAVDEVCVVGGGEIYRQSIEIADFLHLTRVHCEPEGDTFFPSIDPEQWSQVSQTEVPVGEKDTYPTTYIVYHRRK